MAELENLLRGALPLFALLGIAGVVGLVYVAFKRSQSPAPKPKDRIEGGGGEGGGNGGGEGG